MIKKEVEQILRQIAEKHRISAETVRSEIIIAMEEAQKNADPQVQSTWASIPRKGESITIEEFLVHMRNQIKHL